MAGGDLLPGLWVVHIFYAVLAQHQPPIGFCLLWEISHDALIYAVRFVELTHGPKPICPGKKRDLFLVVQRRHSLPAAAVFTFADGLPFDNA